MGIVCILVGFYIFRISKNIPSVLGEYRIFHTDLGGIGFFPFQFRGYRFFSPEFRIFPYVFFHRDFVM